MINVVHAYSKKWHFEANVTKCAAVVRNERLLIVNGFGETLPCHTLIIIGVKFTSNGHWDAHIKDLVTAGK